MGMGWRWGRIYDDARRPCRGTKYNQLQERLGFTTFRGICPPLHTSESTKRNGSAKAPFLAFSHNKRVLTQSRPHRVDTSHVASQPKTALSEHTATNVTSFRQSQPGLPPPVVPEDSPTARPLFEFFRVQDCSCGNRGYGMMGSMGLVTEGYPRVCARVGRYFSTVAECGHPLACVWALY